jgi:cysteine synthase A
VNVAAAVQIARRLGPGHTIVTILCDNGAKYQSRLFNRKWLAEKGLLEAAGFSQNVQPASTETSSVVSGYPKRLSA